MNVRVGSGNRELPNSLGSVAMLEAQLEFLFSGDKHLQPSDAVLKGACSTFNP